MKFFLGLVFGLALGGLVAGVIAALNPLPPESEVAVVPAEEVPAASEEPAPQQAAPEAAPAAEEPADTAPDTATDTAAPEDTATPEAPPQDSTAPEPEANATGAAPEAPQSPETPAIGVPTFVEEDSAQIGGTGDSAPQRTASAAPEVSAEAPEAGAPAVDTESAAAPEIGPADTGTAAPKLQPGNALTDNAVAFTGDAGRPLMSIILIDDGQAPGLRDGLTSLSAPITFAVDAGLPDAAEVAQAYRKAGFEVVAALSDAGPLALDAETPADEVPARLAQVFADVPVATALMDRLDGPIPRDRKLTDAVLNAVSITGHGLLTHRGTGVNNVPLIADEAGVYSEVIFREIDEGSDSDSIAVALERASLDAARGGSVIVAGHLRPDTVSTLFSWLLGSGASNVEIAPVSAALR